MTYLPGELSVAGSTPVDNPPLIAVHHDAGLAANGASATATAAAGAQAGSRWWSGGHLSAARGTKTSH